MEEERVVKEDRLDLLRKCYIDQDGNVYPINENQMHYLISEKICEKEGWSNWKDDYDTAEDFLLHCKAFIKVADYEEYGYGYHFVAISKKNIKAKKLRKIIKFIQEKLGVEVILEEEPKNRNNPRKFLNDYR